MNIVRVPNAYVIHDWNAAEQVGFSREIGPDGAFTGLWLAMVHGLSGRGPTPDEALTDLERETQKPTAYVCQGSDWTSTPTSAAMSPCPSP